MTYHAELSTSRRPWLIATPLIIVVVLAAAWSGFCSTRRARLRRASMTGRRSRRRLDACFLRQPGGRRLSVPHRGALRRCVGELKDTQPPLALKLKEILAVAQVWDPKL
jgi:hypothetical protein